MSGAFPWVVSGVTFKTRREFERAVEQLAGAGTKQHVAAAQNLLREATSAQTLSSDQISDIKARLHL